MKNITVISSSLREGSNSEILAKAFVDGAKKNNEVKYISLKDIKLNFCKGCLACQKINKCVIDDDVNSLLDIISNSDILVFATPVYYYGIAGQLKTFLDRLNALYSRKNKFKEVYLLATCADVDKNALDKTIVSLSGWIECFEGVELKKSYLATSTDAPRSVSKENINEVYKLGENI